MDVKKIALLVGALLVAVVTAVMAKNMFTGAGASQAQAAPAVPLGPKVLVAKKALPVGTIIDQDAFTWQAWPKELVQNAYYTQDQADSDPSKLVGTVVRNALTAGQPVTRGMLVGPQDRGFLAAALTPGMRAVSVPVTQTSGVAGFVFPGDRVDLIWTQEIQGGGDGPPLKVSETIVRNLRVLAADQRIDNKDPEGKPMVKVSATVTLEATPRIAEKIALTQGSNSGQLSLSLRSLADNSADLERAVAAGEVKVPQGASPAQEKAMLLSLATQPIDSNTTFTTGGDVSRFQRRTVPARAEDRASAFANKMSGIAKNLGQTLRGAGSPTVPSGPVVRVARGNDVTLVAVGAR